jgi:hypothetical protein
MNDEKKPITVLQALALIEISDDDYVHTFMDCGGVLIGADWSRTKIANTLAAYPADIELAGETARAMGHGICVIEKRGPVFIKTKEDALRIFELGNRSVDENH